MQDFIERCKEMASDDVESDSEETSHKNNGKPCPTCEKIRELLKNN